MATTFTFQNLRGNLADIPTLANGQLFFAEDTHELWIGSSSGNTQLTFGSSGVGSVTGQ